MATQSVLSIISENILKELSFDFVKSSDHGMWKYYLWTNMEMQFSLSDDRGYYSCDIVSHKKPINPMDLIRLFNFFKMTKSFTIKN